MSDLHGGRKSVLRHSPVSTEADTVLGTPLIEDLGFAGLRLLY